MKKKWNLSLILAVCVLLLAAGAGFSFGFDTGQITNDQARIKKELSRVSVSGPIEMRQVARSETGKMEMRVLTDYLKEFQKNADKLKMCSERLDLLEEKTEDAMPIFEISSILQDNENSYAKLKQLVERPEEFLRQKMGEYGSEYSPWIEDWSDALEVTECRSVWEGSLTEVYNRNLERLKKI